MEKHLSTNESRERFLMRLSLSRNHWLEQALFIEVKFISSIYITPISLTDWCIMNLFKNKLNYALVA